MMYGVSFMAFVSLLLVVNDYGQADGNFNIAIYSQTCI